MSLRSSVRAARAWSASSLLLTLIACAPPALSAAKRAGEATGERNGAERITFLAEGSGDPLAPAYNILGLFGDEIRQAASKMNWRGERLSEDTRYAVALTGVSWRGEWNRAKRFTPSAAPRREAWRAAQAGGQDKEAIALGLSLLLDPDPSQPTVDRAMLNWLEGEGVDIDRVALGILEAPPNLRALPAYQYAAADLLAVRATPRLLPFLMHLVNSDDVYLHARALLGLGITAYQPGRGTAGGGLEAIIHAPLNEYGLSAGERHLIAQEIAEAANSGQAQLRIAAALAASAISDENSLPLLQKLARDRAYVLIPARVDRAYGNRPRRILFPVRAAAAPGLARLNRRSDNAKPGDLVSGEFAGKTLDAARKGGQDITNTRPPFRRDIASRLEITALDDLFRL